MKKLFLVVTLVIISFAFLHADVYVKTESHTDAFEIMGKKQPAKDQVTEQWLGDKKFAQIGDGQTIVVDLTRKAMYVIYPGTKSYVEAKLPLDISTLIPEEAAGRLAMMKMTVTVNPTDESKKVGDWNCKGYDINMTMGGGLMSMKIKSWVTTDVPFDWKALRDNVLPLFMKLGGAGMGLDDKAVDEFKKVNGFQVAMEMAVSIMGQEVKSIGQVVEISDKPAPAGAYSVPGDYTKQDKLTVGGGM
jgi:hypothetical protein